MKITWFTGRKIDSDLAATTELGLGKSLTEVGNIVHLVSPGEETSEDFSEHTLFRRWEIPGLKTLSGGIFAKKLAKEYLDIGSSDAILVDWRLVGVLSKTLIDTGVPWFVIDRGPPAYSGILSRIQRIFWKRAWRISQNSASGGFVVSEGHREFVRKYSGISESLEISIIPAGTNTGCFPRKVKEIGEELKIAYVGRLDRNRGVGGIRLLASSLKEKGICGVIFVAGEGNMKQQLLSEQEKQPGQD